MILPKHPYRRWHSIYIFFMYVLFLTMSSMIFGFSKTTGIIFLCLTLAFLTTHIYIEIQYRFRFRKYIEHITQRVKISGVEVVQSLPIGLILYNEENRIEWHNPHILKILNTENIIGQLIFHIFPNVDFNLIKNEKHEITIGTHIYEITVNTNEQLLFISNITEFKNLSTRYEDERTSLGILMLDNIDEATQGMDDQSKNLMIANVTGIITEWAKNHKVFIKNISSDKFILICNYDELRKLEQTRFEILDEVKEATTGNRLPFTISIGFSSQFVDVIKLGQMAQMSLDMSLARGGDQVTVKDGDKFNFFGGRSNATEKRTRVRARVVAHALRDLIEESDLTFVMGHTGADVDSIGAAIGLWESLVSIGKEGYIVLEGINPSIKKMMEYLKTDQEFQNTFITPQEANLLITSQSLVIVVDTHKPSMVVEPLLLQRTSRIVVVDHHRRGEDFISEATPVYLEPYASSTCELVTELIQYFGEEVKLDAKESTALLIGIMVDTKNFSIGTGARTFEAASYLRRNGADSTIVQQLLRDDLDSYIERFEIIKNAKIIFEHIAIVVADSNHQYSQLAIAQAADTLLQMANIKASFVINQRDSELINISARSLGQINVQMVMERLGGGGHLTNAATQLQGTLDDASKKLVLVLQEIDEQEGLFS
jgi:c-di-AMP phosphodiesterase-like protein